MTDKPPLNPEAERLRMLTIVQERGARAAVKLTRSIGLAVFLQASKHDDLRNCMTVRLPRSRDGLRALVAPVVTAMARAMVDDAAEQVEAMMDKFQSNPGAFGPEGTETRFPPIN